MCGLIAIYKRTSAELDPGVVENMTNSLRHRGPEDYGFAFVGLDSGFMWREDRPPPIRSEGIALGHRRLAIFDLSTKGRQPFVTADGRFWMVFNGEIYNYLELRSELAALGHEFTTESDTEVLLSAYAQWGDASFSRLIGIWAVVIWDRREQRLVACRDRVGIKPLYHCQVNGDWVFASEAKALFVHPGITPTPNKQAVFDYLSRNIFPSGEDTLFENVVAIPPGTIMSIRHGQVEKERFWSVPVYETRPIADRDEAVEQYLYLLKDAVKMCLRGDRRVGATVSGGLDSTSIIKTINDVLDTGHESRDTVGATLQAFTASFPGDDIDETQRVDELCELLNLTAHKVFPKEVDDVEQLARDAIYAMEMPFNSGIPIVNTLLLRKARAEDTMVILNGYGGDELFAGFPRTHGAIAAADEARRLRPRRCIEEMRGSMKHQRHSWKRAVGLTLEQLLGTSLLPSAPATDERITDALFKREWFRNSSEESLKRLRKRMPARTELERELRWEFIHDFIPRWIQMEDRISMAVSVVTRQPLLDYRIVEFAFSLDNSLKIRNGVSKFIMREAMRDKLPDSIVTDPRKKFFPGPNEYWLSGALKPLLQSILGREEPMISEFIDRSALDARIAEFIGGNLGVGRLLWRFMNTELWMRAYFA